MKREDVRKRRKRSKKSEKSSVSDSYLRRGLIISMAFCVLFFAIIGGRLGYLMIHKHKQYEELAIRNQTRSTSVTASRGAIYDRNMTTMAASASVENIFLDPLELSQNDVDIDFLARNLSTILDVSEEFIKQQAADTNMRYKMLKRKQTQEVCDRVRAFISDNEIVGVHLEPDSLRYYPNNEVASQLLGFTNTENVGSEGLESYYNSILEGTAGAVITTKGNNETEMLYSYEKYYEASNGDSLVLTLDLTVQRALEKQLQDAIDRYDVLNGAFGIVMDVNTGEVLAMATLGGYDPNHYLEIFDTETYELTEEIYDAAMKYPEGSTERQEKLDEYNNTVAKARFSQWRNRCVSDGYEPGSTFKVITLASAIDCGAVSLNDHFSCAGKEKFEGREQELNCWQHYGHGDQTTAQALQNSCNLAFGHIGLRVGGDTLYDYCESFGLMNYTGIDLPGEASGLFHSRERLSNYRVYGSSYLISTSFGQTVKPTPLQIVRAISAVVNGGYLLEPYIVSEVLDEDGNVVKKNERTVIRQVISAETSDIMCDMIESVVTEGTAKNAKVVGYSIGGKTGTSEKTDTLDESGNLTNDKIVSFVGVAPMESPQYIVLVALDTPNPNSGQYVSGGVMAAPTVAAVFEDILPYLGVEANYSSDDMYRVNVRMPNLVGKTEMQAASILTDSYLEYKIIGEGDKIVSQIPAAGKEVPGYSTVTLYMDDSMPTDTVEVPNLMGMTVSEATATLNNLGLYLQAKGTDSTAWHVLVTSQDIAEGTEVALGTTITVIFADTTAMD
ncbi:MAG: PASTA domain-containing protein [Ruminococcaceae bacterium]|nr:PASTA domain-containing protein [Oscillospiraceae bacterium]